MLCAVRLHVTVFNGAMVLSASVGGVATHGSCCCWRPRGCPWSILLLAAMLILVVCAAPWGHVSVCGLRCSRGSCWHHGSRYHQGPYYLMWSVLPLESMLMFMAWVMVCAATSSHVAIPFHDAILMSMACSTAGGLYWCLWFMLPSEPMLVPPKALLMSMICAPVGGHDEIHCPCCHQASCWVRSSMVQLEAMWMDVCGPCCHWHSGWCLWSMLWPCWRLCSMLLLAVIGKEACL